MGYLFPGSEDWKILPGIIQNEHDVYIEITAKDSFYQTRLEEYLRLNTSTSSIMADGNWCQAYTALPQ